MLKAKLQAWALYKVQNGE